MDKGSGNATEKLSKLRSKQKVLEGNWQKTGNRSLLQLFIDIVPELLNAERCSIFVYNPPADTLWLYCGTDLEEGEIQVNRKGSMVGYALSTGRHHTASGLEDKAGIHEIIDSSTGYTTCNTLSVPIFNCAKDQVIGVFQVLNKRGSGHYTDDDIALIKRLVGEINRYIESAFKHQEMAEILVKIKKKIQGIENSLAKRGVQQRFDEETLSSTITSQIVDQRKGRLH